MIAVTGPHDAREEGICQACTSQRDTNGTKPDAQIYVVEISKSIEQDTHSTSFRLCGNCLHELARVAGGTWSQMGRAVAPPGMGHEQE